METIERADGQGLPLSADQPTSATASDTTKEECIVAPEHVPSEPDVSSSPATAFDDPTRISAETQDLAPVRGEALSAPSNESATALGDIVNTLTEQESEEHIESPGGLDCITGPAHPPIIVATPPPPVPIPPPPPPLRFSTPTYHSSGPVESRGSRLLATWDVLTPYLEPVESRDSRRSEPVVNSRPACIVCLDDSRQCQDRPCCAQPVCRECLLQMVHVSISDGVAHVECPNPACSKALTKDEVIELIGENRALRNKYDQFLVDAGGDSDKKTCPRCCLITEHKIPRKFRLKEDDVRLSCASCGFEWCFKCHAPWHTGLACRTFKRGDKQFQDWTKGKRDEGDANCRQCPTCRVYIQRNQGCDHMTCSQCESEFCYKCGGVYRVPIPGVGNHHTKLSVFGCEYNYTGSTTERKAVRGGYLAVKIASLTGYPFLFAGGVALLLGAGVVVVPIYIGYRVYRYHKNISKYKVHRRR